MMALLLFLTGLIPSFHDWPHRHTDGTCRCRGFCCTRVAPAFTVVEDVHWLSDRQCFPGEYRPVTLPVVVRRPAVVPRCRGNRHGHITWPILTRAPFYRTAAAAADASARAAAALTRPAPATAFDALIQGRAA